MCMSPSQLLLATHTPSQLLAPINNATYVYIAHIPMYIYTYVYVYVVQKRPSTPIPRPCHAHKVDTSPAFHQYHAEEIGYTTTVIFNWDVISEGRRNISSL